MKRLAAQEQKYSRCARSADTASDKCVWLLHWAADRDEPTNAPWNMLGQRMAIPMIKDVVCIDRRTQAKLIRKGLRAKELRIYLKMVCVQCDVRWRASVPGFLFWNPPYTLPTWLLRKIIWPLYSSLVHASENKEQHSWNEEAVRRDTFKCFNVMPTQSAARDRKLAALIGSWILRGTKLRYHASQSRHTGSNCSNSNVCLAWVALDKAHKIYEYLKMTQLYLHPRTLLWSTANERWI